MSMPFINSRSSQKAEDFYLRGVRSLASFHLEDAVQLFRQATDLDPGHENASLNLARVLDALGNPAQAMAQYRVLLQYRPGQPQARRALSALSRRFRPARSS